MSDTADRILAVLEAEIVSRGGRLDNVKSYTAQKYRDEIFNAARYYWKNGTGFISMMNYVVKFGLRDAFDLGAADMGISPDDYTEADIRERDAIIEEEKSHVRELLQYVDGVARTPITGTTGAPFSTLTPRLELWSSRFNDVRNRAKIIVGRDAKLEWIYGDTEHCSSCARLNGVVKRASFWQKNGVLPQNPPNEKLECGGWRCKCKLEPTTKPVRRGRMPRLP